MKFVGVRESKQDVVKYLEVYHSHTIEQALQGVISSFTVQVSGIGNKEVAKKTC